MEEKTLVELLEVLQKLNGKLFEQEERLKNLEKFLPAATFTFETIKELQSIVHEETVRQEQALKKPSLWERLFPSPTRLARWVISFIVGCILVGICFLFFISLFRYGFVAPWAHCGLIMLGAGIFFGVAEYSSTRSRLLTTVSATGGTGLLWLTVSVAYGLYAFLTIPQLFLVSALLALVTFALSLRYISSLPMLISLCAGYIMPMIVSGALSLPAIMLYVYTLGLCSFIGGLIKAWEMPCIMAFLGLAWYAFTFLFDPMLFVPFICLFFTFFTLVPSYFLAKEPGTRSLFYSALICCTSGISFVLCCAFMLRLPDISKGLHIDALPLQGLKYLSMLFGTVYVMGRLGLVLGAARSYILSGIFTALAIGFYAGALFFHFESPSLIFALQGYALSLFALSFVTKEQYLRLFSLLFWAISFLQLLSHCMHEKHLGFLFYHHTPTALGITFGILACMAFIAHRFKGQLSYQNTSIPTLLEGGAALTLMYWVHTFFWQHPSIPLVLGCYGFAMGIGGYLYHRLFLMALGAGVLGEALYLFFNVYLVSTSETLSLLTLCFAVFSSIFFAIQLFFSKLEEHTSFGIVTLARLGLFIMVFLWVRMYVLALVNYYVQGHMLQDTKGIFYTLPEGFKLHSVDCGLTLYYLVWGIALSIAGFLYQKISIRFLAACFFGVAFIKLLGIAWSLAYTMHRIVGFLTHNVY